MPMPAGNFIIIAVSLAVVLTGGLWVFFWWRGRYGVWAREREARGHEQSKQNVTVIGRDSGGWYGTGGAMGAMAAAQALDSSNPGARRPDVEPSDDLSRSGGSSSEPGLGERGNFDSSPSGSSGSDASSSSDSGGGGGDSGGSGD